MSMLKTLTVATGLALAAFATASQSARAETIQTIDCAVDKNRAERTICASQHLQILDAKITEVYADMMNSRRVSPRVKDVLRDSQYSFLSRRDACGANYGCLEEVMSMRLGRIRNYY